MGLAIPMEPLALDRAWSDAIESIASPVLKELRMVLSLS
jgi:hypothetical protein